MKVTLEMTAVDMAVIVDLLIAEKARLEKEYNEKRADYVAMSQSMPDFNEYEDVKNAIDAVKRSYKLAQEEYEAVAQALEVWQ